MIRSKSRYPRTTCRHLLAITLLLTTVQLTGTTRAEQNLESEGMAVIGNSEMPKALFIVPWKEPEAALAPDRPINSLLNDALQPVDPDIFRRKLLYFDTVHRKN